MGNKNSELSENNDEKKQELLDRAKTIDDKQSSKKTNKKMIGLIILILILLVAVLAYVYLKNNNVKTEKISSTKKEVKSEYKMNGNDIQDFDLYFLQVEEAKKNAIYSPLSIKYTLAMLQEGAEGDTKQQISSIIGDYKSKKYTNNENLALANAMFIKNSLKDSIKKEYTEKLNNKYNAEVIYDDFTNASNINNWISKNTLNLLNNLMDDESISNLDFLLVNSLAIDMEWNYKLQWESSESGVNQKEYEVHYNHEKYDDYVPMIQDKSEFKTIPFNNGTMNVKAAQIGASINNYDIIKELGESNIRDLIETKYREYLKDPHCGEETGEEAVKKYVNDYIKEIGENYKQADYSTDFQFYTDKDVKVFAKDLKTYNGTTLQYVGIMPITMDLDKFIAKANAKNIGSLIRNLKSLELSNFEYGKIYKITGYIPFFKYDYQLKLQDDLNRLGIKDVFNSKTANLSKLTTEKGSYISSAIHKANIDFSNDGIKASAATIAGGLGAASCDGFDYEYDVPVETIDLTFDKPFMYIIRDKSTGEVWFTGSVYSPSENY